MLLFYFFYFNRSCRRLNSFSETFWSNGEYSRNRSRLPALAASLWAVAEAFWMALAPDLAPADLMSTFCRPKSSLYLSSQANSEVRSSPTTRMRRLNFLGISSSSISFIVLALVRTSFSPFGISLEMRSHFSS